MATQAQAWLEARVQRKVAGERLAMVFDLDETLLDHGRSAKLAALQLQKEYRLAKWTPDAFVQHWEALSREHIATHFAGHISFQEHRRRRIRAVFENPLISDTEADAIFRTYLQTYEATWSLFDDAIPCLDDLAGFRLGVITNGDPGQQRRKLKATGIDQRFETEVFSGELGIAKPDPGIFHEACRRLKISPGECVMVGDNLERDVLGARSAGMQAIWLRRDREMPANRDEIVSLHELRKKWNE